MPAIAAAIITWFASFAAWLMPRSLPSSKIARAERLEQRAHPRSASPRSPEAMIESVAGLGAAYAAADRHVHDR